LKESKRSKKMRQILHPRSGHVSVLRKIYFDRHTEGTSSSHQTKILNFGMPKTKVVCIEISALPVNKEKKHVIHIYKVFKFNRTNFRLKLKAVNKIDI